MRSDRLIGAVGFAAALLIYVYYTAWVIVAPFVDPSVVWFHALFPDQYWAFAIPITLLVLGVTFIATFVGIVSRRGK